MNHSFLRARTGLGHHAILNVIVAVLLTAGTFCSCQSASSSSEEPKTAWRGAMMDVSRHFFPLSFLEREVDALSAYGMTSLHLHLTDAAGWRMQIMAYPRLTEYAAWRTAPDWKSWWNGDRSYAEEGSEDAWGGYYTQDQLRQLVVYATERGINIVPEIEMPGHSEEVEAAYPELALESVDLDSLVAFYERVLTEVMEVFPSTFIHIGGDETDYPKQHELIARIATFLHDHGRRAVGWDEILNGNGNVNGNEDWKLPEDVVVMVWRGMEKAHKAIAAGHDVVLCPGQWCYLDKYQDALFTQPEAIGGYLPFDKVCAFRPFDELSEEEAAHVLGIQGNLWTEYVGTEQHAERMLWPRLIALDEIARKGEVSNMRATRRVALQSTKKLKKLGIEAFNLRKEKGERHEALHTTKHLAAGCPVSYGFPFSPYYPANGDHTLTDGKRGGWDHGDGAWQGFIGRGFDVTVDLQKMTAVKSVEVDFYHNPGVEIFMPGEVTLELLDGDGHPIDTLTPAMTLEGEKKNINDCRFAIVTYRFAVNDKVRSLHLHATPNERRGWLFTDEIVVK